MAQKGRPHSLLKVQRGWVPHLSLLPTEAVVSTGGQKDDAKGGVAANEDLQADLDHGASNTKGAYQDLNRYVPDFKTSPTNLEFDSYIIIMSYKAMQEIAMHICQLAHDQLVFCNLQDHKPLCELPAEPEDALLAKAAEAAAKDLEGCGSNDLSVLEAGHYLKERIRNVLT